jgi:integrase/recombinase XerD
VETRKQERPAGATESSEADVKGKIVEFLWELKKQGFAQSTIRTYRYHLMILHKRGANILDPESVKETIAIQEWSENTRALSIHAYDKFLEVIGGRWEPPKHQNVRKLPFIPLESELDQLISGAYKKLATLLQLLKETAMRSGEAWRLMWTDIDLKKGTLRLNKPEKQGNPRMFKISPTLMAMLNTLSKNSDRVFEGKLPSLRSVFRKYRLRMAHKLQNPRLTKITFHTFRHWKATMEYAKTKDILHVMKLLGHKDIKTTLIYTQLIQFESDEFHSATAKTIEEAEQLVEAGFEYVCTYNDVLLFRKHK